MEPAEMAEQAVTEVSILRRRQVRVSWGALLAGFFVDVGLLLLLLSLAAGMSLTRVDVREPATWFQVGPRAGIWGGIAAIVASFFAAWVTGRLSSAPDRVSGMLHGVVLWGVWWFAALWLGLSAAVGAAQVAGGAHAAAQAAGAGSGEAWSAFLASAFTLLASALGGMGGTARQLRAAERREPVEVSHRLEPQRQE
jgi:hypothetical protein